MLGAQKLLRIFLESAALLPWDDSKAKRVRETCGKQKGDERPKASGVSISSRTGAPPDAS